MPLTSSWIMFKYLKSSNYYLILDVFRVNYSLPQGSQPLTTREDSQSHKIDIKLLMISSHGVTSHSCKISFSVWTLELTYHKNVCRASHWHERRGRWCLCVVVEVTSEFLTVHPQQTGTEIEQATFSSHHFKERIPNVILLDLSPWSSSNKRIPSTLRMLRIFHSVLSAVALVCFRLKSRYFLKKVIICIWGYFFRKLDEKKLRPLQTHFNGNIVFQELELILV